MRNLLYQKTKETRAKILEILGLIINKNKNTYYDNAC